MGAARLNVQGLARRDKKLMQCILPEEGMQTVSIDLSAGEPTVTAHFSRDKNYRYATFDGVGKAPYWDGPTLMIDDIYLQTMSVSPVGSSKIIEAWNTTWRGNSFVEQWLTDSEVIKTALKKERQFHKIGCLGFGYGMGAKKFVASAYNAGYIITLRDSKLFYDRYWALYSDVRKLADLLGAKIKRDGYVVNPFGYRLTPPPHKAFNYFIQSSVSGIMHVYCAKLFAIAPYAVFRTVIHDEVVADCPIGRLEEFRTARDRATDSLNADLKWSVNIRTGFAPGKNWYEAK